MPKNKNPQEKGSKLAKWTLETFVRKFKEGILDNNESYAFFLGAGTSFSSGIPLAGELTDRWIKEIFETECSDKEKYNDKKGHIKWAKAQEELFPNLDPNNLAKSYPHAIQRLSGERPGKLNDITSKLVEPHDPGPAYVSLAKLMTETSFAHQCNQVLTTNFDDMVADAIYLYTRKKPLSINDHSLVPLIKNNKNRPIIIKLHGDGKSTPLHLPSQLNSTLDEQYTRTLEEILEHRGLVFFGYGGNDKTIINALQKLPATVPSQTVYWINDTFPQNELGDWLVSRHAVWVQHLKFDDIMLMLHQAFDLEHPDWKRFDKLKDKYDNQFVHNSENLEKSESVSLKKSAEEALLHFKETQVIHTLYKSQKENFETVVKKYEKKLEEYPNFARLRTNYATYLRKHKKFTDSEKHYLLALEKLPRDENVLAGYACLLQQIDQPAKAIEYYKKAISESPLSSELYGNLAELLLINGKNIEGRKYLDAAFSHETEASDLLALHFYQYAFFPDTKEGEASHKSILQMLDSGIQATDYLFEKTIEAAEKNKHPNLRTLKKIADRIQTNDKRK